jgi:hypothetical protein
MKPIEQPELRCGRCGKPRHKSGGHYLSCECFYHENLEKYKILNGFPTQYAIGLRTYYDDT